LAAYYTTWYHKFGDSKWHMAWETWYQYESKTPNVNNPAAASLLINNANGAYCDNPSELTCFAPEWATVNYLNRQVGKKDALIFRNEYLDDLKGQRTGFKTPYTTTPSLGITGWNDAGFPSGAPLRHRLRCPGLRFRLKHRQLMFAADMIWFF